MENLRVLILGKGRVGQAVAYYLKKFKAAKKTAFFDNERQIKNFDILIGALPSKVSEKGLKLALKYKKDLIDVSAVAIPFYLKHKKEIFKKGIKVIPGCGFSPGLVNLIVGFEWQNFDKIENIEIEAGTLPTGTNFFFPFTWCFEDLIEEHLEGFSGYKEERLKDIGEGEENKFSSSPFANAREGEENKFSSSPFVKTREYESYFIEEWNSLLYTFKSQNISFRVIRPIGFFHFFQYLKNYGFFKKENISFTKKILTEGKKDNITLGLVKISGICQQKKKEVLWRIFSFAKKQEKLNSMQKITALVPVIVFNLISQNKIQNSGISFLEEIGKNKELFQEILIIIRKEGILIKRK